MFFGKNDRDLFLKQYNHLSASLLLDVLKEHQEENVIISPFSILMLLTIAAESTAGETKTQITDYLCGKMDYDSFLNEMLSSGNAIYGKQFRSANAVCVNSKIRDSVSNDYINRVNSVLHGKFFSSENMSRDVNEWVKEMTGGKIDQVADNSINDMLLCLLNAVSFEGEWLFPYTKENIRDGIFTSSDGTAQSCNMMNRGEHNYVEGKNFTGFTKAYKDGIFSFMALLPKKEGKENLIRLLSNRNFSEIYKNRKSAFVHTSMPKFRYDFTAELTAYCKRKGIEKLFRPHADFSPVTPENLMADSIFHKGYISADENGTKAGAKTAMLAYRGALPGKIYNVHLNRPFVFAVIHHETMLPIFAGVVNYIVRDAKG